MECYHGNQQRVLSGKLTGSAADRSNDTEPRESLFNLAARWSQCGEGQRVKPGCRNDHTVRTETMCEAFQEAWPLREEERVRAEARIKEIWTDDSVSACVRACVCVFAEGKIGRASCRERV